MSAARKTARIDGLVQAIRAGQALISEKLLKTVAADAAYTILNSDIAGGMLQFTGLTAGRNLTVPTGASLTADFPDVDVGESLDLQVSVTTAFALTLVAATGTTLAGRATVPASSHKFIKFTRTGAATWQANCF